MLPKDNGTSPPIVANRTTKRAPDAAWTMQDVAPAWNAFEAAEAARRAYRTQELADARPVRLVDVRLSFGTVAALWFQVTVINVLVAAVVVAGLFALDVI